MGLLFIILVAVISAIVLDRRNAKGGRIFIYPKDCKELNSLKMVKAGQRGVVLPVRIEGFSMKRDTLYSGLGRELKWQGKLPEFVNDYVRPRYVYEDMTEMEEVVLDHGMIIGYRISPTLVISSMVGVNYRQNEVEEFIDEFGGKFLTGDEVKVLKENFDRLSDLRKAVGDTELPKGFFWIKSKDNELIVTHHVLSLEGEGKRCANIILKR